MSLVSSTVRKLGPLGGYAFARQLCRKQPRLLMYHRFSSFPVAGYVSADEFEWQVSYIAKHFTPVTVSDIALSLYEGENLPTNNIAITVDDGYEDFYSIAWPILRKYRVPATFYVTTGFVNGDLWLWPDQLRYLLERSPKVENTFDFGLFSVETPLQGTALEDTFWRINQILLKADNEKKLQCLAAMSRAWQLDLPACPPDDCRAVTWAHLKEMQAQGLEVGGHTVTHPSLARVNMAEARSEIFGCYEALENNLGQAVRSFCYPNGTPDDFVGEQVELISEAGFSCATVAFADSREQRQRYAMRRHASSSDRFQFLKAVSGIELLGMIWRKETQETPYE
ncbi:polysaccharide deacetylase family protein [Marinobacter sp. TBZ242]|uniref:Polysaccharide deacetylase family protein n=1 Tax=Marinobacter azerbaijanicus TaxID=3050455 RepID=A0ABT7I6G8_9GAMM|nr:polysaccharide deacetylase family protein [Marinobacter sp. TBZ242]MDL0429709.1 polysaccharide deacetylase family protein [Marinobacter sp. TBZ242]